MAWTVIEVSARAFHVPMECSCCGGGAETQRSASYTRTTGKRVIRQTTRGMSFPYCHRCSAHVDKWESAGGVEVLVFVIGLVASFSAGFAADGTTGFLLFLITCVLTWVAGATVKKKALAQCHPGCASPQAAVEFLGWSGAINTFRFSSSTYAIKFGQGNAKKLINVSPALAQLLQQSPAPQVAVARTPVARSARPSSSGVAPQVSRVSVTDWIDRIEGYKGSLARRNALERALEEVRDPRDRHQLLLAASKIEVRAVLDRVDSLKSIAAKRRYLQQAIEQLRLDNVPDELQAAELQILEQRLHSLK
jgi:hypothetical protein